SKDDDKFRAERFPRVILNELNRFRISKGLDTLEMTEFLLGAAEMSSQDMADSESEKIKPQSTAKYLKIIKATKRGEELSMKGVISKSKEDYTTGEVAKVIYNRWENNAKDMAVLLNPKYTWVGIAGALDEEGEKVYVSAFFGGYDITNDGI